MSKICGIVHVQIAMPPDDEALAYEVVLTNAFRKLAVTVIWVAAMWNKLMFALLSRLGFIQISESLADYVVDSGLQAVQAYSVPKVARSLRVGARRQT